MINTVDEKQAQANYLAHQQEVEEKYQKWFERLSTQNRRDAQVDAYFMLLGDLDTGSAC